MERIRKISIKYTHKIHNKELTIVLYKDDLIYNYNNYIKICEVKKVIPTHIITFVRKYFFSKIELYFIHKNKCYETNEDIRNDKDKLDDKRFSILMKALSEGNYEMYNIYKERFNILPHHEVIINDILNKNK